ncbi:MAG TPA: SprT family zinc-dependent metalloprotease [Clostridia bacterium]|nr:SprT family zinc-dependent metalloprotease [Clostridia bacterium]
MTKTTSLTIGAHRVSVTRKRIKNLYLRVQPQAGVLVSAPLRATDAEISRFVLSREDWIEQQQAKLAGLTQRGYDEGDTIPYFGKSLTLRRIDRTGRSHIALRGDVLELHVHPDADEAARKKIVDGWYRAELYEAAGAMLPAVERTVGKRAGELKVRDMKTRWGTCNIKTAMITLNLRLAERPAECLRYVLTHELCHLHEAGHGERFWKRMDVYYPDWKRVRKLLKQHT